MPANSVYMKELPKHVAIVPDGVNPGLDGYIAIGNYDHEVNKDELGNPVNHTVYDHVRDLLYKANHTDAAYFPISVSAEQVVPDNPGPMDFISTESRASNYSVKYTMGTKNCFVMLSGRKERGADLPQVTVTHGGEPLKYLFGAQANDWVTFNAVFVGENLTLEEADLVITANMPITPLIGRVTDRNYPMTDFTYDSTTDNSTTPAIAFDVLPDEKWCRFICSYAGYKGFTGTQGIKVDIVQNIRANAGTVLPDLGFFSSEPDIWTYDADAKTMHCSGGHPDSAYLMLDLNGSAITPGKSNLFQADAIVSNGTTLSVIFVSTTGAEGVHNIVGPYTGPILVEHDAAYSNCLKLVADGEVTLNNPIVKADSLTITSVIAATPEPVDLRLTGGKLTYLFNQYGYASLVGISYREIK